VIHHPAAGAQRRLRADAQRNRDAIVDAARALFTERGATVSLDDITRAAGVGPATFYRNFPTREDLLREVLAGWEDQVRAAGAKTAAARRDPAESLRVWLSVMTAHTAVYHGVSAALLAALNDEASPLYNACLALTDASDAVLTKAAHAGVLADGVHPALLARLTSAVHATAEASHLNYAEKEEMLDVIHRGLLRPGRPPDEKETLP
jgi:AcrR family transcriptional regulator